MILLETKKEENLTNNAWQLTPSKIIWSLRLIYVVFMFIPALMTRLVFPNVGPLTPEQVEKMFLAGLIADLLFYAPTFIIWLYLVEQFKRSCLHVARNESFDELSFKEVLRRKKTLFLAYLPLNVFSVVLVSLMGIFYLQLILKEPGITFRFTLNFILTILAFVLILILFALLIVEFLTNKFVLQVIDAEKVGHSTLEDVQSVSLKARGYLIGFISSASIVTLIIGAMSDKISLEEMGAIFLFLFIYLLLSMILFSQIVVPIVNLQGELKKLQRGELISGERVPIESFDEIGTLAQLYNLFLSKFYESLGLLQDEADRLNGIITDYQHTFATVMSQVRDINSSLGSYSTATQEISDNTQLTSEFLNGLVEKIETWGTSIMKLAGNFKELNTQIKILSLNAAIEAAREGQSKGGFAVIAQNIRQSSDMLQKINQEVVKLTTQLQEQILQDAQHVKASLEENVALIEENASQIEEITATLEEITAMVEQLQQQTEDIANVSKNLTTVVSQYLSEAKTYI